MPMTEVRPPGVMSRPFALLLLAILGGFVNMQLLFAVVPAYATTGGAGTIGAGFVTGALMVATVLTQPQAPRLAARIGYPATLATGLVLLGVPALALPYSTGLPLVLGVSLVRGFGFGIITVTGSALTAELVPAARRGAGMGLYGAAVGVPGIVALPLGVWLAGNIGYTPVFIGGGVAPLLGVLATSGIRAPRPAAPSQRQSVLAGFGMAKLTRLFLVLCAATAAGGVTRTFLPLAVPDTLAVFATVALFAQMAGATVARVGSGLIGDRVGAGHLLVPGTVTATVGMVGLIGTDRPVTLVLGAAVFGLGLGILQTVTLVLMLGRVDRSGFGAVSAQWNIGFDSGTGLGAVVFGVLVGQVSYPIGFAATAALLLAAAGVAWRDRAVTRSPANLTTR